VKTYMAGDGSDSTAAAVAFLQGPNKHQFREALLILIGEYEDPDALFLTDWETPLLWRPWGLFKPGAITNDKITSKFGFEAESFKLQWSPPSTSFTKDIATTSPYQLVRLGLYDNRRVRIWRTTMPTPGDADTLGACEHFGGWVASAEVSAGLIDFDLSSYLSALNQKLPANTVEKTNTLAAFVGGTPVLADGETSVPTFTVQADSSSTVILGDAIQPTAHKIYGTNKLANGYLVFLTGSLKGMGVAIGANSNFNAGGGVHYNQIQVFTPFPWVPSPGDTFYVATAPPNDSNDPTGGVYQVYSFDFVPDPETNL